jgi:3alpha(or 20beta)-hydroxysteroid dehydrogenase
MEGRTFIVTGAARGQGAAEAEALVREGAHVVATDLLEDQGRALAERLGDRVTFVRHDVASQEDWRAVADALGGRPLHGLVNNAGAPERARLDDVTLEAWNRAFAVNVTGAMLGIQTCVPLMAAGGAIVNVGSVAALTAYRAVAYTASKWALRGLTRVAATDYGPRGIRVNLIHPGYIETPILEGAPQPFLDASLELTPMGRPGSAEEVAALVLFLLSEKAAYITGAEISIDGGYAAHGGAKLIADAMARAAPG